MCGQETARRQAQRPREFDAPDRLAAFLDDFYVRPVHRGRGVGSAAIALLLEQARQLGVRAVHLEVGRDNAAAQAVYGRSVRALGRAPAHLPPERVLEERATWLHL